METINQNIMELMQERTITSEASANSVQMNTLRNADLKNCQLRLENVADMKITNIQEFTQNDANELISNLEAFIDNEIENTQKNTDGAMTLSASDIKNDSSTRTRVKNQMKTSLSSQVLNQMRTNANNTQVNTADRISYDPCAAINSFAAMTAQYSSDADVTKFAAAIERCGKAPCVASNEASVHLMAQQVTSIVTDVLMQNGFKSTTATKVKNDQSNEKIGLFSWQTALAIIACVILIGIIMYAVNEAKTGGSA